MKMNMTKKSKIAIVGMVIALLIVTTVAAFTTISNTWTSPYITVSPLLLDISSDLTETTIQPEVPLGYHMTLENPNTAYNYANVHVMVYIYDVSGDLKISLADVTVEYYDPTATPGYEWKTITFIQGDNYDYIYHDWSGSTPFTMPPGSVTILFRATYHTPGIYYAEAYAVQ
jgi:hypothetical protein